MSKMYILKFKIVCFPRTHSLKEICYEFIFFFFLFCPWVIQVLVHAKNLES